MLGQLINRLATPLYVQIWASRFRLTDLSSGNVFEEEPLLVRDRNSQAFLGIGRAALTSAGANAEGINPFSHPRVLLADFLAGQMLLKQAIKAFLPRQHLRPTPFIIIHPMEKTEGGLTIIERRAFLELGLGAGASDVRVYEGEALLAGNFDVKAFKANSPR